MTEQLLNTSVSTPDSTFKRKHPLANCQDCPWYSASGYAGASGPEDAKVLIIGEAPGKDEIKSGKPFTGPSGKLLDRVLSHHGFNRDEIRLTNVVACHPKGRKAERPPKAAITACSPRVQKELEHRETVILLGKTAHETVMETRVAITKARQGPARTHPNHPGTRFVSTIHPAACLRSSDYFPSLVRDIKKAKTSETTINWEPPKFKVFDDEDSAISALDEIYRLNPVYVAVDIECPSEKDEGFTHPDRLLCIGIAFGYNRVVVLGEQALQYPRVRDKLRWFLASVNCIYQNGKFDEQVLIRLGILDKPYIYGDTMLASYCLDERPGHHSLDGMGSEHLGAPDWKGELKPYLGKGKNKNYANVPRPVLYKYNAFDAGVTYNLWHDKFEQELAEQNLRRLHDFLVSAGKELIYLELDGVRIDENYLGWLLEDYGKKLEGLEEELKPWVGNPRSTPQVLNACHELLLMVDSTGAPILNALLEGNRTAEQREFLEKILHYRKEHKLYGTYVKGTLKRLNDNRLYTTFKLHGTVTGRLSSANPNLQNIPRGSVIKNLFIPEDGNLFVQADYKQAEWRAIACLASDSYLQQALSDPKQDIHSYIATLFFGPNFTKNQRVMAKTFVFGVAYGRGPEAIARAFGVSVARAQQYIDDFFRAIPDVVRWRKSVHEQIFSGGQALQTPFGRKRRFWLITRENKHDIEKEALAFLPQSIASDLTLHSLIRIRQSFGSGEMAPKVRLTVHDSILCECTESDAKDVAQEVKEIMESTAADVFSDFVPFPVDLEVGKSWGNLKELV